MDLSALDLSEAHRQPDLAGLMALGPPSQEQAWRDPVKTAVAGLAAALKTAKMCQRVLQSLFEISRRRSLSRAVTCHSRRPRPMEARPRQPCTRERRRVKPFQLRMRWCSTLRTSSLVYDVTGISRNVVELFWQGEGRPERFRWRL